MTAMLSTQARPAKRKALPGALDRNIEKYRPPFMYSAIAMAARDDSKVKRAAKRSSSFSCESRRRVIVTSEHSDIYGVAKDQRRHILIIVGCAMYESRARDRTWCLILKTICYERYLPNPLSLFKTSVIPVEAIRVAFSIFQCSSTSYASHTLPTRCLVHSSANQCRAAPPAPITTVSA